MTPQILRVAFKATRGRSRGYEEGNGDLKNTEDSAPRHTGIAKDAEAAEFLRTTRNQLSRLRYEGHGPRYVKLGRSVRYRWEDLYDWVDSNVQATSEGPR